MSETHKLPVANANQMLIAGLVAIIALLGYFILKGPNNANLAAGGNAQLANAHKDCKKKDAPWIRVLHPNGGEVYSVGQSITVTWASCNIPASTLLEVNLYSDSTYPNFGFMAYNGTPNNGTYTFTLAADLKTASDYILIVGTPFTVLTSSALAVSGTSGQFAIDGTNAYLSGCNSYSGYSITDGLPCWLQTQNATSITSTSAILNGYLFDGGPASIGWGMNPQPFGISNSISTPNGPLNTSTLGGLTPNTTYQFQVCATNSATKPDACGGWVSFTTLP